MSGSPALAQLVDDAETDDESLLTAEDMLTDDAGAVSDRRGIDDDPYRGPTFAEWVQTRGTVRPEAPPAPAAVRPAGAAHTEGHRPAPVPRTEFRPRFGSRVPLTPLSATRLTVSTGGLDVGELLLVARQPGMPDRISRATQPTAFSPTALGPEVQSVLAVVVRRPDPDSGPAVRVWSAVECADGARFTVTAEVNARSSAVLVGRFDRTPAGWSTLAEVSGWTGGLDHLLRHA